MTKSISSLSSALLSIFFLIMHGSSILLGKSSKRFNACRQDKSRRAERRDLEQRPNDVNAYQQMPPKLIYISNPITRFSHFLQPLRRPPHVGVIRQSTPLRPRKTRGSNVVVFLTDSSEWILHPTPLEAVIRRLIISIC